MRDTEEPAGRKDPAERFDAWIARVADSVLRWLRIDAGEETRKSIRQFIKFGMVGATSTAVSYGINVAVLKLLQGYHLSWDYVAGNLAAFVLSVLWSYYWNNKYVFTRQEGQERNPWETLLKTYLAYGFTGILLTNALSYIWIEVAGISKFAAPLINLIITIPVNFIVNKKWAYRA